MAQQTHQARLEALADPWCWYCGGWGRLLAVTPGGLDAGTGGGTVVRCVCTRRSVDDRVLRAVHLHLARHAYGPSLGGLAGETGLPKSTVRDAVERMIRQRVLARPAGKGTLRVVR
jgi:hypothetical protein